MKFPAILCAGLILLFAGCVTPVSEAPRAVVIPEEVAFAATPPIGFPTREYTISKGRFIFWRQDAAAFYYVCEGALVSRTEPGSASQKVPGGLGIDRSNGRFFIWKKDISVGASVMAGPVIITGQSGRDIQTFLAEFPKNVQAKLQIEQ